MKEDIIYLYCFIAICLSLSLMEWWRYCWKEEWKLREREGGLIDDLIDEMYAEMKGRAEEEKEGLDGEDLPMGRELEAGRGLVWLMILWRAGMYAEMKRMAGDWVKWKVWMPSSSCLTGHDDDLLAVQVLEWFIVCVDRIVTKCRPTISLHVLRSSAYIT